MAYRDFQGIAMELALLAAGHRFPRLSQVGAAWGEESGPPTSVDVDPPTESPVGIETETDGYGIFLLDVTVTDEGKIHLIEANGSNAALSSSVLSKDDRRANHMYHSFMNKKKPPGKVSAILAYQPKILHLAEFFGRAGIFAQRISEHHSTSLCNVEENLGEEEVSIVCGAIPDLASHITRNGNLLYYKNRPVVFGSNPNLLPELARRGSIRRQHNWYDLDTFFYHDGKCTPLVHDKGLQQDIAQDTGITPLHYELASSEAECLQVISRFHMNNRSAVGKMNAGSGGAGIEFFPPTLPREETEKRLKTLFESVVLKYGENSRATMFPIRFFEFAQSSSYDLYGEGHLWDLRIQCLIYPNYTEVTPCVMRLCPKPFDSKTYDRDGVLSNLTGREPTNVGRFMRSPAAMRRSQPCSVLDAVGIDKKRLNAIVNSCAKWCESGWRHFSK